MRSHQWLEEALRCNTITLGLKINIYYLTIFVDCSPQIMLLAIDLHEDFIDVEGIAVASVFSLQPFGMNGYEINAPESDGFVADLDTTFSQEIFDISIAQVESVVEPNCRGDDIKRESVAFVGIHGAILMKSTS